MINHRRSLMVSGAKPLFISTVALLGLPFSGLNPVLLAQADPATTPPAVEAPAAPADAPAAPADAPAAPADAPAAPAEASAAPADTPPAPAEPSPSDQPAAAPEGTETVQEVPPVEEPQGPLQLANPTIARGLKLSREQRDQIAKLIAERETAIAAAAATEHEAIEAASDAKLLAVLTEVQRGDFLGQPVDKRLQFMFRYQPWEDVLDWFAEQAELSLVLDSPPPGTFNYTDTREYTPHEAIDLLNGVLTSKGFTLVRRGRMLMVIDLSDGIPEGIVPRVELTALDEYGKFEFVTVQFDLGRRDGESVLSAIKPLLSPYGKTIHVDATAQLYVTDRAGIMVQVESIIQAIPEPIIKPRPEPTIPIPPVVEMYAVTNADVEAVMTVLKALVPTGTIVLDPNSNKITVHATPNQQSLVKDVLEQMEAGSPEDSKQTLEIYPIGSFLDNEATGTQLLSTLNTVAPKAQVSINSDKKSLVAWARPSEHAQIEAALEKLKVDTSPRATRQMEVHRLTKVDPQTTLSLFESILPDARLAVDAQTRTLIAVAVPADQEVIRNTLKTLQPSELSPDTPELRFYELTLAMPPDFPDVIQKVAPGATVALDSSGMRLMVIASPLEHTKVERTIQNLQRTTFIEGRPKLVFYPVTPFQRRRFDSVWPSLSKELPGVSQVTEGAPGELAIWARPHQHEVILEILEELKREIPDTEKFKLITYPLTTSDPKAILDILETLYPEIKFVLDSDAKRLLVWTSQQEQDSIKLSLEELNATGSDTASSVELYRLTKVDPTSTLSLLQSLIPDAKLSLDARSESLVAIATAEEHQTIQATLDKLQPAEADPESPQLQFYPFEKEPTEELLSILGELAPTAKITVDAEAQRLAVVASATNHETIKATLDKALSASPADSEPQLQFYSFSEEPAAEIIGVLEELAPEAKITVDSDNDRLVVLAKPADQERIKANFEQITQATVPKGKPELKAYPVQPTADIDSLQAMLEKLYPDAEILVDAKSKRLLVWAPAEMQTSLATALDQLGAGAVAAEEQPRFESYPIHGFTTAVSAKTLVTTLETLAPNARFTIDDRVSNLIVWASPAEHTIISGALERLGHGAAPQNTPQLEVYRLNKTDPAAAQTLLKNLVPEAKLSLDAQSNSLIALAVPADHATIKATLDQLQMTPRGPDAPTLRFHLLTQKPSAGLLKALSELVPDAKVTADDENERLSVVATETDHGTVKQIVEEFERNTPPVEPKRLVIYTVTPTQRRRFESALTTLKDQLTSVQVIDDTQVGELAVWATPTEHVTIADLLEQLKADVPEEQQAELGVYSLKSADPDSVTQVIEKLFPDVEIVPDKRGRKLMIWARPIDQQRIRAAVEQIDSGEPGENLESFRVYSVEALSTTVLLPALQELVPDAKLTGDLKSGKILATATAADHKIIDDTIRQMETRKDSQVVVYTVDGATTTSMIYLSRFLTTAVPNAQFSNGAKPDQLVAWASAEDHQQIKTLVDQMTGGDTPQSAAVYDLQNITATSASTFLRNAVPDAMLTVDTKDPQRLTVWATADDHDQIKAVLEQIDLAGQGDLEPTAVIYTIEGKSSTGLLYTMRFLGTIVPNATFTIGGDPGQIVAWATAKDHVQIKSLVDQITLDPAELNVYTLKFLPAASASAVLRSVVPAAQITPDENNPLRMTVMASAADHAKISDALAKIDVEGDGDEEASAVVYQLDGMTTSGAYYALKFLASTFPNARFVIGAQPNSIVAWATPKDHQEIKVLAEQLGQEKPELQIYTLQFLTAASATSVLRSVAPDAKITEDTENPKRLTVWATKLDHTNINEALLKIDVEGDAEVAASAVVYRLEGMSLTGMTYALRFLTTTFPDAQFVVGAEAGSLVAWATPEDHEKIKTLVDQLGQQPPDIAVYDLKFLSAANAQAVLASAVPQAKLTADPDNPSRLTAWANASDQAKIKDILAKIDLEGDPQAGAQVIIYSLAELNSQAVSYAYRFLTTSFPDARFSPGAEPGSVVVWATAQDHEKIAAMVDQLTKAPPPERAPNIAVYATQFITAAEAAKILLTAVPQAKITPAEDDPQRMTAWARPSEHVTIAAILQEIDVEGSGMTGSTVAVYELKNVASTSSMTYTLRLLATAFPNATFSLGTEPGQVVAWASAKDHQGIQELFDKLSPEPPPEEAPKATVYALKFVSTTAASTLLRTAVPDATVTLDTGDTKRLTVWASPADQTKVASILAEIDIETDAEDGATAAAYRLTTVSSSTGMSYALRLLTTAFPESTFLLGAERGQFIAWATTEEHIEIKALVDQLNAGPSPEETPKATVYTLQFISATNASAILRSAVPNASLTMDTEDPRRMTAWATPEEHATIATILTEIDVAGDPAGDSSVGIYELENVSSSTSISYTLRLLATAFPKVRFSSGTKLSQIVAWATADEHKEIQALFDKLNAAPAPEDTPKVTVYSLQFLTAATASQVLRSAVPDANVTLDTAEPQRLTVWATPEDHATIAEILTQIDVEGDANTKPQAVVYQLKGMSTTSASYALRFLGTAFPKATFTAGAQPGSVVAWATAEDHTDIKALVDQLEQESPDIIVYDLKFIAAASVQSILATAVPQAKLTPDPDNPQRLTAWAIAEDHATIKNILEKIDVEGDPDAGAQVVIYSLAEMDPGAILYVYRFLTATFPAARFSPGAEPGTAVVWASAKDHEQIKQLIDQITQAPPPERAPKATVYSLKFITAAEASGVLRTAIPQAKITPSTDDPQRMTVWARPNEHDTVAAILLEIDVEGDADTKSRAVVYQLKGMTTTGTTYALRFLASAFPNARFTAGAQAGSVVAWATTEDHADIKSLVDQLEQEAPDIVVYDLQFIAAANAQSILATAVPQAKLTPDPENPQRLTAWAIAEDHATIKSILEKIDVEGDPEAGAQIVVYSLAEMDPRAVVYAYRFLSLTFPAARFSPGAEPGTTVVWATAKDHEQIKQLIEQITQAPPPERAPKATVYSLKSITAAEASGVLRTAVPQALITPSTDDPQRMTIWARPNEHETVAAVLLEIDVEGDADTKSRAVVYQLKGMTTTGTTYALRFLASAFPNARFTAGAQAGSVVAWATTEDHADIKSLVDQLEQEAPDIIVYDLQFIAAANAQTILATAVPQAKLTPDPENPQRFTAWAIAEDHATIKSILEKIDVEGDPEAGAQIVVYSLAEMDPRAVVYAYRFLSLTFPAARFSPGAEPGTTVVWATAKDHAEIKQLIEQITQAPPPERAPKATVYSLKSITAAEASGVLKTAVPQALITPSTDDPQRMTVWARPAEHDTVAAVLLEIDVEGDPATKSKAAVYQLKGMDSRSVVYALRFLATAFPNAEFTAGAQPGSVVAWATAEDHTDIQALVDQLEQEAPDIVVYDLKFIAAAIVEDVLGTAVPDADLTLDPDNPQRFTAWAIAADHATIQSILEKIDLEADPDAGAQVVVYSLAEMDPKAVAYAYRFLLQMFPAARFSPGAESGTVVVWATPKDHSQIAPLIEQITQAPPPERAPVATVYSTKFITAAEAAGVLKTAVPQALITPSTDDPQRMTVFARPAEHITIAAVLKEIDVEGDPATKSTAVVYQLKGMDSRSVVYALRFLGTAFPNAQFTAGAQPGSVVAWATASDHTDIRSLVDQLEQEAPDMSVYELQFITAANAQILLAAAVPDAELTPDPENPKRLAVWAIANDHATIKGILEKIDVAGDPESQARAAVYQLKGMDSRSIVYGLRFLASAFPDAQFTAGAQPGSVVAWATPDDHTDIQALVDQLEQDAPDITVYNLKFISATAAQDVLATAVPDAGLTLDPENPQRFTAWAIAEDHATIQGILEKIDLEADPATGATVVVYSLAEMDPRAVTYAFRFLMQTFPDARFSPGAESGSVVVWATAQDHAELAPLIEQLTQAPPAERAPKIAVYGLKFITAADAATVLSTAVPQAELTPNADDPQRLTAWARPSEHETIAAIIKELDVEGDPETQSRAVVYQLKGMDSKSMLYALRFLASAFPNAQFTQGAQPGSVVAWANAGDHQKIQALTEQLALESAKIAMYDLKFIPSGTALDVLASAVPEAELTADAENPRRFTAWAIDADQETIQTILEQIDVQGDPATLPSAVVYELEGIDSRTVLYVLRFLMATFPDARFVQGADAASVVAWATAEDHKEIDPLIKQLAREPAEITVYSLKFLSASNAEAILAKAVPEAELTVDAEDPQRLTAWAGPTDHATIKSILTQIDVEGDPDAAAKVVVYTLESMDDRTAAYAVRFLISAYPDARFTLGADPGQLVAWAAPRDHTEIALVVQQLNEKPPAELARSATLYSLQFITATEAASLLESAVPQASFSVSEDDPQRLTAWARPSEHATITEVLAEIDIQSDTEPTAVVYTLEAASSTDAMRILREAVPQARLTVGSEPHQLIAWARPADHKVIAEMISKMSEKGPEELNPKVVVYTIGAGDAADAIAFLQTAVPGAEFSVGSDPRRLIAWARPADHEIIKRAVDELVANADKISTKVYRFRYANPQAAYEVLQTLVPTAQMAVDDNDQSLVVSGMPEDHQKIQATVDEMDRDDIEGQRPNVKIHRVEIGNAASVYRTLYLLFRTDDTVQLSLDADNDSIVAIAPPAKHDRITELIQQVEAAIAEEKDATMELYSMRNVDSSTAMQILGDMLEKQGSKAELTYDYQTNQIIVIGDQQDHEFITATLDQLRGDEPVLEIYELQYVDPMSAELAISRQFADEGLSGPEVDTDPITEQLFVRAKPEHQDAVRELLIKMGETKLALLKGRSSRSMRTISFQGDVQEAIREIQKIWPTLRKNEIRVVEPTAVPAPTAQPATETPPPPPAPPATDQGSTLTNPGWYFVAQIDEAAADADAAEAAPTAPADGELPPVYIVPGDGNVTIVCDDPAALEQFEQLLRTLSPGAGEVGRNISVYEVKHASAVEIAAKLQQLYSTSSSTWQRGLTRVSIVPDERLNTIVVQGSRIDRETIAGLIRVMDSDQGDANKPKLIALKNADANDVAEMIRETYRSQLSATSTRTSSSSSRTSGITSTRSFVPSIAVDEATNSLIIVAASPLLEDIIELATTLDQSAGENRARGWRIISLQKSNAARIQETLQQMLGPSNTTSRKR